MSTSMTNVDQRPTIENKRNEVMVVQHLPEALWYCTHTFVRCIHLESNI